MEKESRGDDSKENLMESPNCDSVQKDEDNLEVTPNKIDNLENSDIALVTSNPNEFPISNIKLVEPERSSTCDQELAEGLSELSLADKIIPIEEVHSEGIAEVSSEHDVQSQHLETSEQDIQDLERKKTELVRKLLLLIYIFHFVFALGV